MNAIDNPLAELPSRPSIDIADKEVHFKHVAWIIEVPFKEIFRVFFDARIRGRIHDRVFAVSSLAPIHMRPNCSIGPNDAKYGRLDPERMEVASGGGCRHSVLPISILEHLVRWLLILKYTTNKLESWCIWQLRAWRCLKPKR